MNNILQFIFTNTPLFYLTQSLWRDEAFSVWIANGSLSEVISRTSGDFNPPLYYALLNIWIKLFGRSEIALRSLSVCAFVLFLVVVYKFALHLFKNKIHAWQTTLIALLNPMLLYFAFEVRMYAFLVLFAGASTYFLYTKKWKWYVLFATAGMYTQPFMAFVLVSHGAYLLFTKQLKRALLVFPAIGVLFLPWVPTIITQFKSSGPMWMWPIDMNLIASVLGNVFMGYEGTPGNLWNYMKVLSLLMIIISIALWHIKKFRPATLLFYCLTYIPLTLVLGISVIKPIYVHRYVIFVAIGEVFLLSICIITAVNRYKTVVFSTIILFLVVSNIQAVSFHRKVNFRQTFMQIQTLFKTNDQIIAADPISYYESWYYAQEKVPVLLYNPNYTAPPRYVGSAGMEKDVWVSDYPIFPRRAFFIHDDGKFEIVSKLTGKP